MMRTKCEICRKSIIVLNYEKHYLCSECSEFANADELSLDLAKMKKFG